MSKITVLVVDDHAVVRHTICALLAEDVKLHVICQAATGEEAVAKAEELHPELVLMDISLPKMSGIESARQIRKVSPRSKIIFLSQHDSMQMAKEALRAGGYGYVSKIDAANELLEAIRAVCQGLQFVSKRLLGQDLVADIM
jgi:DNA-binding NarL/FixJ family response regulator